MKVTALFFGLALLNVACILTGCSSSSKGDGTVTVVQKDGIDLYMATYTGKEKKVTVPLSDLVESCELIRFENTDEALISANFTLITDKYIGVRQSQAPYKLFDRTGKFVSNVGAIGQGPGEYSIIIHDDVIDEKNQRIYLSPFYGKKIMMFDLQGKSIKDIPLPYQVKKPKISVDGDIISIVHMPFQGDKALALQVDIDGNVLSEYPASENIMANNFDGEVFSYKNSNAFDFFHTSMDTLFHYISQKNALAPVFTMQFPAGYTGEDNWIHFPMELPDRFHISFYNYETGESRPLAVSKTDLSTYRVKIVNDFYGNMEVSHFSFNQGYFVMNVEPAGLLERIEKRLAESDCSKEDKEKLKALEATIDEDSNNLLFLGKLKQ